MAGKGESLVIQENVFASEDLKHLAWTDSNGITRYYDIVEGPAQVVEDIANTVNNIATTVTH